MKTTLDLLRRLNPNRRLHTSLSHHWFHLVLALYFLVSGTAAEAASPTNFVWRFDNSAVTEGQIIAPPGPGGVKFRIPANSLWKGKLTKGNTLIVDNEKEPEFKGFSTPDFEFGNLSKGNYTFYVRLVGVNNSTKTYHFSVGQATSSLPPPITKQPQSVTVDAGSEFELSVETNDPEASFQWKKNGVSLADETESSLFRDEAELSDAGAYFCLVSNAGGATTSATATVNVRIVPPVVTKQPQSIIVDAGKEFELSVEVDDPDATFQWKKKGVPLVDETEDVLSWEEAELGDEGDYVCVASNAGGATTTRIAHVTVLVRVVRPVITKQPQSVTVDAGKEFELSVEVDDPDATFQWRKKNVPLAGETEDSLARDEAELSDAGAYSCVVSNAGGATTTETAHVTVRVVLPVIVRQPQGLTVNLGHDFELSVEVDDPTAKFQWKKNGTALTGETGDVFSRDAAESSDAGAYMCVVSNAGGTVTSATATVTVRIVPPVITKQPLNVTVDAGKEFELSVEADDPNASFQWKKNGTALADETENILSRDEAGSTDAGNYVCVVSNAGGAVTSTKAIVIVRRVTPPVISRQPVSITVNVHGSAVFRVRATGPGELSYRWFANGEELDAAEDTLTIEDVTVAEQGNYYVVVSNAGGSVTSATVKLTVQSSFRAGQYTGLFYTPEGVLHESSGSINIALTKPGRFSGSAKIGLLRYSITGQFDGDGAAAFQAQSTVRGGAPLDFSLTIGEDDQIKGSVVAGEWEAEAHLDRAVFGPTSPCPYAGALTVLLPPDESNLEAPFACGFLTARIATNGSFSAAGRLADGTPVIASCTISGDGNVALYVPLYSGKGSALGWLNVSEDGVSGIVSWIKPATRRGAYVQGFATAMESFGGPYTATESILPDDAVLVLSGATLAEPIVVSLQVGPKNQITGNRSGVRVTINANGSFTGRFLNPKTQTPLTFSGALNQSNQEGFGFFQAGGESGNVYIGALLDGQNP